jgi:restriction system protein
MLGSAPTQFDFQTMLVQPLISLWWCWAIALILMLVVAAIKIHEAIRLNNSGIREIDYMTGEQFEERLKILFNHLGYNARRTVSHGTQPDYGVDLIIEKNGIKTAVQAKRYRGFVGEDAVRQVYTAMKLYNCTEAMVVTNSHFSQMAYNLAKSTNVKLWNRNRLINTLLSEKI